MTFYLILRYLCIAVVLYYTLPVEITLTTMPYTGTMFFSRATVPLPHFSAGRNIPHADDAAVTAGNSSAAKNGAPHNKRNLPGIEGCGLMQAVCHM